MGALIALIAALMINENNPRASENLLILALLLLGASGFLWVLDENDRQKRKQAIGQAIEAIDSPSDQFVVKTLLEKTLLEDDPTLEKLRQVRQIIAA